MLGFHLSQLTLRMTYYSRSKPFNFVFTNFFDSFTIFGGADGIRTHYLFNAIEALSQLSYSPVAISNFILQYGKFETCNYPGGADGIRTHYLFSAIEALSQLSYGPERDCEYIRMNALVKLFRQKLTCNSLTRAHLRITINLYSIKLEATMGFYGGRRSGGDDLASIDWDDLLRRRAPNLRRPLIIGVGLIVLYLILISAPRLYTDYRWFQELGYESVFTTELVTRIQILGIAALAFFLFYAINVTVARRLTPRITDEASRWAQVAAFAGRSVNLLILGAGLFLAIVMGLTAQSDWLVFLRYLHPNSFGISDPVFSRDVSFYVFTIPIYQFLIGWVGGAIVLAGIATAITYAMGLGRLVWTPAVKGHLSALGAGILGLSAWNYQLEIYNLVFSARGVVYGASYTDVNAQIPAYTILMYITIALAVILLVNVFLRALKAIGAIVALWIVAWVLVGQVYPAIIQNFEVKPSEFTKEQPYIKNHIALTRQAYALDGIQESNYPADDAPTSADIRSNADTINNIRLQDYRPLLQTFNQIQSIRTYYDFSDVDIDRYTVNGQYRQLMLSARELSPQKLTDKAQTWVNLHLLYTHGYGAAVVPVNEFTSDGLPTLLVKDIPPVGAVPISRPEIYFGEETTSYVFVKTSEQEFDFPRGDDNAFTTYQGTGGVSVGSFWDRLLFAARYRDLSILLTNGFTTDTRILFNRQIQSRIHLIAPWLMLDRDPYLVIADGKLYWMQDAYTYTDRFPYSEPFSEDLNYIRNSVKIAVDAYNGTTTFYVNDPNEPLVKTYRDIFPALFRSMDEMPASLKAHIRFPEYLFSVQADMYRTYHMQDPQVFYNKEDLWAIPTDASGNAGAPMEPYYVIMRLPGETKEEFMLMLPFTPAKRQNMVAWMSAKSDGADYGKRLVYRFPKDKLVYGPEQIHARLNQDPAISSQLTLLNQRGSGVQWGNLLVIPVNTSLIYVQPMYLIAEQSQIPQLKYVVVATSNLIVMDPTLGGALARIFTGATISQPPTPGSPPTTTAPTSANIAALTKEANDHYTKAQDALKVADWATYGKEMQALQQVLAQLLAATGQK